MAVPQDPLLIKLVPHDPGWLSQFEAEALQLKTTFFPGNLIAIHHIGSTAIPHICAKPVIDILVSVKDLARIDADNGVLAQLGYKAMGENGIPDRRFFLKNDATGYRTHHVHIFESNSPQITRHLNFRDYLIAHPEVARRYEQLKLGLAQQYGFDRNSYTNGKNDFIREIDQRAVRWRELEQRMTKN